MLRRKRLLTRHIQQNATTHQGRQRLDPVDSKAGRCLHAGIDVDTAVQGQVLGLV
jgi:hypothetical protein